MESQWVPSASGTRYKSEGKHPQDCLELESSVTVARGQALGRLARLGFKHYCPST